MSDTSLLHKIKMLREKALRARRLSEEVPADRPARTSLAAYADDLERRADELEAKLQSGSDASPPSPPDAKSTEE
jgi:hypothetical protein